MKAGHKYEDAPGWQLWRLFRAWFRNRWYWLVAVLAGTVLVILPRPDFATNTFTGLLLVLLYMMLVFATVYPQQRKSGQERTAIALESRQALSEALAKHMIIVDEIIGSLLVRLTQYVDSEIRVVMKPNDLILRSIQNARAFVGALGTTANASFYSYSCDGQGKNLTLVEKTGNGEREKFDLLTGDPENLAVGRRLEAGETTWCRDILDPVEIERLQLDGNRVRSYVAFMTVPVERSGKIIGMLSVNTAKTGFINEHHESYLKVLALLIAMADDLNSKIPGG